MTRMVVLLGGVCESDVNLTKATGSPVGVPGDLGRAGSGRSLVRPGRVAGSVGLLGHLTAVNLRRQLSVERETLYSETCNELTRKWAQHTDNR